MLAAPADTTPVLEHPPVAALETPLIRKDPRGKPLETNSGTDAIARAVAAISGSFSVLVTPLSVTPATGTVNYDLETLPLRTIDEGVDVLPEYRSRSFRAFKDLGRWLALSDTEVATMVGIRRTTAYAWERDGHEPRPATVRRLMQQHALVASVIDRLGEPAGQAWLLASSPNIAERLLEGDIASVDRQISDLVFARTTETSLPGAFIDDEEPDIPPSELLKRLRA